MGLPHLHVLAAEPRYEGSPQPGVNVLKVRAGNCECDTRTKMAKATDVGRDWRALCRNIDKMLDYLLPVFAGQTVKHRQVSREKISIRRKVLLTKTIEWLEVAVGNACCQDQRLKSFQNTKPSLRVSDIGCSLAANRTDCESLSVNCRDTPRRNPSNMVMKAMTFVLRNVRYRIAPLGDLTHRVAF